MIPSVAERKAGTTEQIRPSEAEHSKMAHRQVGRGESLSLGRRMMLVVEVQPDLADATRHVGGDGLPYGTANYRQRRRPSPDHITAERRNASGGLEQDRRPAEAPGW
jgi:hypothetical protein